MQPNWVYSWPRDLTVWMLLLVGALAAAVVAILMPAGMRAAGPAFRTGNELIFFAIFVAPMFILAMWALGWWAAAARRVLRLRRLTRMGISTLATVEKFEVLRHPRGGFMGLVLWLQYTVEGQSYSIKKKTMLRGLAARARDLGNIELAVDPQSPKYVAFVVNNRLG
jgi:hypothetical protein